MGFSGFGFPKAHSAAFGLLAYQSTWLRVHYHPEFLCSLLNEQPMGFYPPDALVHEAQRCGVEMLPPCAVARHAECRVEDGAVRMGLGYVTGVKEAEVRALVTERGAGWRSLGDLAGRSGASAETLGRLAWAGACDALVDGEPSARRRRAPLDARRGRTRHAGAGGHAACAAARPARGPRPARAQRVGAHARRLRVDRGHPPRAPARADAAEPPRRPQHEHRARDPSERARVGWRAS